ncbi:hypothetical protein [Mucilaginibacter sp.]
MFSCLLFIGLTVIEYQRHLILSSVLSSACAVIFLPTYNIHFYKYQWDIIDSIIIGFITISLAFDMILIIKYCKKI